MPVDARELSQKILDLECGGNGLDELIFLCETIAELRPQDIFEWGTNRGGSALAFYKITRAFGLKTRITTVETEPDPLYATCIEGLPITKLIGSGPETCIPLARDNRRTIFFLDGAHDYKTVRRELDQVYVGAPWATILVHDTMSNPDGSGLAVTHWPQLHSYHYTNLKSHAGIARLIPR